MRKIVTITTCVRKQYILQQNYGGILERKVVGEEWMPSRQPVVSTTVKYNVPHTEGYTLPTTESKVGNIYTYVYIHIHTYHYIYTT